MIRKKNLYSKPQKPFEAERIKEENVLMKKYGLKNKKEVWKTVAKVNYFRGRAKALAQKPLEEQEVFFNKLKALGLNVNSTAEVLDLKVENILERRLPTVVKNKKIADTVKQARQLVSHKKILIAGKVVSAPGYLVPVSEESLITLKKKIRKPVSSPQGVDEERGSSSKSESDMIQSAPIPEENTEAPAETTEAPAEEQTETPTEETTEETKE